MDAFEQWIDSECKATLEKARAHKMVWNREVSEKEGSGRERKA